MTDSSEETCLGPRFEEALAYAARLHANQRRKLSDTPYVAHLLAVAAIVLEYGGDEDEAIAALLHDAVEDQGGHAVLGEIEKRFGQRVARIVDDCSDAHVSPKPPWRERKERHLIRLAAASDSARLVIAADKLHNLRSLVRDYRSQGSELWTWFSGGRDGTLWYYREMLVALAGTEHKSLLHDCACALGELEALVAVAD